MYSIGQKQITSPTLTQGKPTQGHEQEAGIKGGHITIYLPQLFIYANDNPYELNLRILLQVPFTFLLKES